MTEAAETASAHEPAEGGRDRGSDRGSERGRLVDGLLRPPRSAAAVVADALRIAGGVSVIVAAVGWSGTDAGVLAFTLPGLLLPRIAGARAGFDIAYCVILLVAAWSNVLDLYRTVDWWDLPVHFACTGVLAAMLYLLMARFELVAAPAAGIVIITAAIGLAASALWEMVEWFGHAVITDEIFVSYDDTVSDLAIGGLGAITAGFAVARAASSRQHGPRTPSHSR